MRVKIINIRREDQLVSLNTLESTTEGVVLHTEDASLEILEPSSRAGFFLSIPVEELGGRALVGDIYDVYFEKR